VLGGGRVVCAAGARGALKQRAGHSDVCLHDTLQDYLSNFIHWAVYLQSLTVRLIGGWVDGALGDDADVTTGE